MQGKAVPAMIQQMTMILPVRDRSVEDGENPMGYKRQSKKLPCRHMVLFINTDGYQF